MTRWVCAIALISLAGGCGSNEEETTATDAYDVTLPAGWTDQTGDPPLAFERLARENETDLLNFFSVEEGADGAVSVLIVSDPSATDPRATIEELTNSSVPPEPPPGVEGLDLPTYSYSSVEEIDLDGADAFATGARVTEDGGPGGIEQYVFAEHEDAGYGVIFTGIPPAAARRHLGDFEQFLESWKWN